MCGICGTFGFDDRNLLLSMCARLAHRGPDGQGIYIDDGVGIGNTRLAMIDLRTGHQPAHNEDETVWLVFNGEMYNYPVWLRRLQDLGHRFYSQSDSEVLVHMYEEFGPTFVSKVNGMFALALWDRKTRQLLLTRDRFGVKPLYYARIAQGLVFNSEIKPLTDVVPKEIDVGLLPYYFLLRYTPGVSTLIPGIKRVLPGTVMVFRDSTVSTLRYWSLTEIPKMDEESFSLSSLRSRIVDAVRSRLVSDVPLGVFLSGGVDSAAIVAVMKHLGYHRIKTFTIGFDEGPDESLAARRVSEFFSTEHYCATVEGTRVPSLLYDIVSALDEPNADPAAVPTYILSSLAKKHVKGILLGEGADEIFGGYEQYRMVRLLQNPISEKLVRLSLRTPAYRLMAGIMSPLSTQLGKGLRTQIGNVLSDSRPSRVHLAVTQPFTSSELARLTPSSDVRVVESWVDACFAGLNPLRASQRFDIENTMGHLLCRADRMTMAHSIEGREPYLDHRLVELATAIPPTFNVGLVREKRAFRLSLRGIVPSFLLRRRKRRFFVPIQDWFSGNLGPYFDSLFDRPTVPGVSRAEVRRIRESVSQSPLYRARQLWSLLTLEIWHRAVILGENS